ncbi:hypothetical protein UA08_01268 [Talaromyces atroroseus]|uniref:DUF6590 domain-containing protein n=1 Tax=Talaromyces atroroseus TaxID=1441469 RepID=A0A1Q5QCF4_TALAT|nr:hypothetical protein UA08_01268 [Talaromyces atroroseus]OKL63571.1 hypothetical protein UA08_01268 [Talaromyces atroroseus]
MSHKGHSHGSSFRFSPGYGVSEHSPYQYANNFEHGDEDYSYGDSDPSQPQTPQNPSPPNPPTREPWGYESGYSPPLNQQSVISAHETLPSHDSNWYQQSSHNAYPSPETPSRNGQNPRRQSRSPYGGIVRRGDFFTPGRIFVVRWFETAAPNAANASGRSELIRGSYGQMAYGSWRRMAVIRTFPGQNSSTCVSTRELIVPFPPHRGIYTYGARGLAKRGLDLKHHAILFDESVGQPYTEPNEPELQRPALAVSIDSPEERLDPMSRINFGKLHTVEHNVEVRNVGCISVSSMAYFNAYVNEVLLGYNDN